MISINVESDKSMQLSNKPRSPGSSGKSTEWELVCKTPCQRRVPRSDLFRVTARALHTAEFELPELGARALVQVRPGYWGLIPSGAVMTVLGGGAAIGGVLYMVVTFFREYPIGLPLLAGGAAVLIAGSVMVAKGQTSVHIKAAEPDSLAPRLPVRRAIYLTPTGLVF